MINNNQRREVIVLSDWEVITWDGRPQRWGFPSFPQFPLRVSYNQVSVKNKSEKS